MEVLGPPEVLLDGEEEGAILGQLGQLALRVLVEIVVLGDLGQEPRQAAGLGQGGHAEEDPARVAVLGDRLQGLEIL